MNCLKHRKLLLTLAAAGCLVVSGGGQAVASDFYAGKTIRVAVGFSAGGGYDTYTRILARQ